MSDFLAVAGVTSVIRWMLIEALAGSGLDTVLGVTPSVTALPPDRIVVGDAEPPQLNLFMYHVGLNAAFRNADLPELDSTGRRLSSPPLALDLHYLLSAYGRNELDGEILLGWAMQLLHEQRVLTRDLVQNALSASAAAPGATSEVQAVGLTTLADQAELVKLTPQALTTEDVYKLWTAFQARYRATTGYMASVVLVQRSRTARVGLPVQVRNILVEPLERPIIDEVAPGLVPVGGVLTLRGRNFVGDAVADTMVSFDGAAPVAPDLVQPQTIRITVPAMLLAGVRSVQVVRNVQFGAPTDPHAGLQSEPATFILLPTIVGPPASVAVGTPLTLTINPPVGRRQRAAVLIGSQSVEIDPRPLSAPDTQATLSFPIPPGFTPVPAPGAPLRVRIDGAESAVTLDAALVPPAYVPRIVVTP
jgi:hypothetical protein